MRGAGRAATCHQLDTMGAQMGLESQDVGLHQCGDDGRAQWGGQAEGEQTGGNKKGEAPTKGDGER